MSFPSLKDQQPPLHCSMRKLMVYNGILMETIGISVMGSIWSSIVFVFVFFAV